MTIGERESQAKKSPAQEILSLFGKEN